MTTAEGVPCNHRASRALGTCRADDAYTADDALLLQILGIHLSDLLYKSHPDAKDVIKNAGGFRKFCEQHSDVLEYVHDWQVPSKGCVPQPLVASTVHW